MDAAVFLFQHANEIAAQLEKVAGTCGSGGNSDKSKLKEALGATSNTECVKYLTALAAGLRAAAAEVAEAENTPGKVCVGRTVSVRAGGRRLRLQSRRSGRGSRKTNKSRRRSQKGGCATLAVLFLTALAAYLVSRGIRQANRPLPGFLQWLLGVFALAVPQQAHALPAGDYAPAQFANAGLHLGNMDAPIPDRMRATFPNAARFNAVGPLTANNMERFLAARNRETRNIRANVNRRAGLPADGNAGLPANHGVNGNVRLNARSTVSRGPTYRGMTAAERNAAQQANLERRLAERRG
jgi:hypothetical protein